MSSGQRRQFKAWSRHEGILIEVTSRGDADRKEKKKTNYVTYYSWQWKLSLHWLRKRGHVVSQEP
eukprot:992063-Pelagomonas_calceolata.AAC.1